MRIDSLPYSNSQTQGAQRRAWLDEHAPQHIRQATALLLRALQQRDPAASQATAILGAGACTEVPLAALANASDEVALVDFDLAAMRKAHDELSSASLRKRLRFVQGDITGGVSTNLTRLLKRQRWDSLIPQGARAVFDAAALCLEQCPVPDPPALETLDPGGYGLVISSLVLSQLFSYPLLDVLDHVQSVAPAFVGEQERHRRYQDAAQAFRIRVINAHLHLLRDLLDSGGVAALLNDVRGFVFNVHGTDHDAAHRRAIPLVPRVFPELVSNVLETIDEVHWEWLTDLPDRERPGRGYEVVGYLLKGKL